jgi:hypothetical protein
MRFTSAADDVGCAEKSSSFDGKFAQMMVHTKINPATEMEFVTAFPDRSSVLVGFITVRIK